MAQVSYGTITITDTTDIESIKNWYLATNSSSGVTKTTSGWTDTIQQMTADKQYLWNYEQILGTGNVEISSTQPVIIGHYGINGTNGTNGVDGNSITSIDEYYKITSSPTATSTNPGSTGWTKNGLVVPTNENRYLWNYQVINYSKTTAEGSYTDARVIGVYGDTGERGSSILKVTTTPTSTSGTAGGFSYTYRMSLSTVKSQSGKSEVLIGDVVEYNSNHYRVGYVDSSYVYLSAATSIKGADGQTYYTWIKYAPNDNPTNAQISDSPTGMTYIGIYTGTTTPAPSTASSYAPWMKYIGTDGGQGPQGVSVTGTRELYWLKTTTNPSQITWNSSTSQPSQTIYSTDRQNSWTSVVPTYEANAIYYTCIETSLSNATKSWSAPVENKGLTSANQKALDAYNTSTARDTEVNALKAQAKHFWWDSEGAHIAAGQNTTSVDNITQGQPDTYTFNALTAPGYLKLRYKNIDFAQLATNSLTFYRPAVNGSTYVQGKKGMDLTADALTFYKPLAYNSSNEPAAAATLNSNGLVLSEGGIKSGDVNAGNSGFVYLSTKNYGSNLTINSHQASNWREIIGTKFGVDADGNLYANGAVISGQITVTSGSNLSAGLGDYSTTSETQSYVTGLGYQTSSQVNSIIEGKGYQTASDVNGAINTATSGLATKGDAIYRTQRIYYRKTSNGAPSSNTTWLTSSTSGTGYGNWSLSIPQLTSGTTKYPYLYTAIQTQTITQYNGGSGTTCSCSAVLLDNTTTIIDGGAIIAGSVTANEITGSTLSAIYADLGAITAGSISRGNNSINFNQDAATLEFKNSSSWANATRGIQWTGSDLNIKGNITAYSLTIGSGATVSGLSTSNINGINNYSTKSEAQGYADIAEANASYSVEIKASTIDYGVGTATLVATPYYQGSISMPAGVIISYQWYKDSISNSNPDNRVGINSNTLNVTSSMGLNHVYICVIS